MTEDNYTIRKASTADLARIHEIYAAARSAARHKRQLSKSAADTENEVPLL